MHPPAPVLDEPPAAEEERRAEDPGAPPAGPVVTSVRCHGTTFNPSTQKWQAQFSRCVSGTYHPNYFSCSCHSLEDHLSSCRAECRLSWCVTSCLAASILQLREDHSRREKFPKLKRGRSRLVRACCVTCWLAACASSAGGSGVCFFLFPLGAVLPRDLQPTCAAHPFLRHSCIAKGSCGPRSGQNRIQLPATW